MRCYKTKFTSCLCCDSYLCVISRASLQVLSLEQPKCFFIPPNKSVPTLLCSRPAVIVLLGQGMQVRCKLSFGGSLSQPFKLLLFIRSWPTNNNKLEFTASLIDEEWTTTRMLTVSQSTTTIYTHLCEFIINRSSLGIVFSLQQFVRTQIDRQ